MEHGKEAVRKAVRERYARAATADEGCCGPSCCGGGADADTTAEALGYSAEALRALPDDANLGLGCGNPTAIASLRPGQTVLDLGSGAGIDCFLAAREVGPTGRVIGVDMTPEMISRARANAEKGGYANVEFRLGEIEALPVADGTVDVIISNCVLNLSPDKRAVFQEAYRVLKHGGRVAISDVVTLAPLPTNMQDEIAALTGCISGAATVPELTQLMSEAGFRNVTVRVKPESQRFIETWLPGSGLERYVASADIEGTKP